MASQVPLGALGSMVILGKMAPLAPNQILATSRAGAAKGATPCPSAVLMAPSHDQVKAAKARPRGALLRLARPRSWPRQGSLALMDKQARPMTCLTPLEV